MQHFERDNCERSLMFNPCGDVDMSFFSDLWSDTGEVFRSTGRQLDRWNRDLWGAFRPKDDPVVPDLPEMTDSNEVLDSNATFFNTQRRKGRKKAGRQGTILGGGVPISSVDGTESQSILGM